MQKTRLKTNFFFFAIILSLSINALIEEIHEVVYFDFSHLDRLIYSWVYLILVISPFIPFIWLYKGNFKKLGLGFSNSLMTIKESLIGIILVTILFFFISDFILSKDFVNLFFKNTRQISLINLLDIGTYLFHSSVQEFIARGILQSGIKYHINDTSGWSSVIIASFIFSILHLHFSLNFSILTFFFSLIFGSLYLRHKNIWGISLLHCYIGSVARVLDFF